MKQLITLVIFLSSFLISINASDRNSNPNLKSFHRIPKMIEIRKLDEGNNETSSSDDEIYDSTEVTYSTEIESTAPSTLPNNNPPPEQYDDGLWLIGFDGLVFQTRIVTWSSYFRYFGGRYPLVITFTVYFYLAPPRFRILEESEEEKPNITQKINCAYNETSGDENFLRYDCKETLPVENIVENLTRMELSQIIEFDGKQLQGSSFTVVNSAQMLMKDFYKVPNSTVFGAYLKNTKFANLQNGVLIKDIKNHKFYIRKLKLNTTEDDIEDWLLDSSHIFTFKFSNSSTGNVSTQEKECKVVKNSDGESFDIECELDKDEAIDNSYSVNYAITYDDTHWVNVRVDGNDTEVFPSKEDLEPDNGTYIFNSYYNSKNSGGLSGGAIAGIIVVCIVVLIVISLLIILLRKRKNEEVGKIEDSTNSALDMKNI